MGIASSEVTSFTSLCQAATAHDSTLDETTLLC